MSNGEGPPIIAPSNESGSSGSGEKSEKKKSKKHLGEFGAIAVESQPTQPEVPKKSGLMEYLTKSKEKSEASASAEKAEDKKEGFFSIPKQREGETKDKKDEEPESFWSSKKEDTGERQEISDGYIPEDVEEATEKEAPTEELGAEESHDIQKVFAEESPSEVEKLSSDASEEEKVAAEAVDRLHDKMAVENADLETAYHEVRNELGLPQESPKEPMETAVETEPEAESFEEQEDAEAQLATSEMPTALVDQTGEIEEPESPEEVPEADEEDEDAPVSPTPAAGSGSTPPPGPGPFRMPGFGMPPIPGQRTPTNVNAAPAPVANKNTYTPRYHETSPAAMALFGGIVGYLIGRRRGRIRAEKKLLPVQKKLREQVEDLEWQLREREDRLRRAAAEAVRDGSVINGGLFAIGRYNTLREQRRGKNAEQLHAAPKAPERIGHMLVNAGSNEQSKDIRSVEQSPKETTENVPERVQHIEQRPEAVNIKRVETMSRAELLAMSENILVEGSSLRQIFETHLISEKGLRRLVAEHLRGGNVSQELRREIVEREVDFERDPGLRDAKVVDTSLSGGGAVQGQAALEKMFEQAAATMPINNEHIAMTQADALMQAEEVKKSKTKQRAIDASIIGIITALITTVVVLYISRH